MNLNHHLKLWKSWFTLQIYDSWYFFEGFNDCCLICTRINPLLPQPTFSPHPFFLVCFQGFTWLWKKKTFYLFTYLPANKKSQNPRYCAVWKLNVNRQRGHMLWKVQFNRPKETFRLWTNQKEHVLLGSSQTVTWLFTMELLCKTWRQPFMQKSTSFCCYINSASATNTLMNRAVFISHFMT